MINIENVDKHIIAVGGELMAAQSKVINTENIPVKELRRMLKEQSENMGVLQWLNEIRKSIEDDNKKNAKIISL